MDYRKTVFTQGQFVYPQHLQQQTRYLERTARLASVGSPANWGFTNLQLDTSQLGTGILALRQAAGRFQDGTGFETQLNASVVPIDAIPAEAKDQLVFLCVPRQEAALDEQEFQQTASDRSLIRYSVETVEVPDAASELVVNDEPSDEDDVDEFEQADFSGVRSVRMMVGQLQLKLMLESSDRHQYLCMPVARVDTVSSNGEVTLNDSFIAPVLDTRASPVLSEAIAELKTVVDARARELAEAVGDFVVTGETTADVLWLMVANRYHLVLDELNATGDHPLPVYRQLIGMAGELATIALPEKRLLEAPSYQHANLQACYGPLLETLRNMWGRPRHQAAVQLPLVYDDEIFAWISSIRIRDYLAQRSFYFAVTADSVSADEIAQILPGNLTIGPFESIFERIQRGEGLSVKRCDVRPRRLPELKNWVYFELEKTEPTWREVEKSEAFAFHVDRAQENFPGLRFRFWAVND
ncbi:MAG: type VI secretion system baseplate subunit TssK [Pseudomonadota bacterium]